MNTIILMGIALLLTVSAAKFDWVSGDAWFVPMALSWVTLLFVGLYHDAE